LRRLRGEALLVREVARTFESTAWGARESLFARSACAGWRIARVVSGRLRSHPFVEYQKDASIGSQLRNRLQARYLALASRDRLQALRALDLHLNGLARQLDDAIAIAWSSDFSEALGRSRSEIRAVGAALAQETRECVPQERFGRRAARRVEGIEATLDGDWPYLAL
jgi:hypothetical protein